MRPLLLSILAVITGCGEERFDALGCIEVSEDQTTCPSRREMHPSFLFLPDRCGDDLSIVKVKSEGEVTTIAGGGEAKTSACCYTVEVVDDDPGSECVVGRPYHDESGSRRAPAVTLDELSTTVTELDRCRRRAIAWSNAGAAEYASVAAFGRLALQLLALGAPAELVRGAHRAALDELGHAELCWSLARRFGEPAKAAGPFPFGGAIEPHIDLAELAVELVRDGCIEETVGAHLAGELAARAPDPDVRAALATIAEEEAEHAVLAFRILAWILRTGGPEARAAVRSAFTESTSLRLGLGELSLRTGVEISELRTAAQRGVREVLEPVRAWVLAA